MVLGDKFYYIFGGPFMILVLFGVTRLFKRCNRRCRRANNYFESQYNGLIWNGIIGFFAQSYLLLVMGVIIQFSDYRIAGDYLWQEKLSSTLNIGLAFIIFGFPFAMLRLYYVSIERVDPFPDLKPKMSREEL
jgi:hypothetical protein